jgi:hypothetical protein
MQNLLGNSKLKSLELNQENFLFKFPLYSSDWNKTIACKAFIETRKEFCKKEDIGLVQLQPLNLLLSYMKAFGPFKRDEAIFFESINSSHPRTNSRKFHKKILRIGEALKTTFV